MILHWISWQSAGKVAYPTAAAVQKLSKEDIGGDWNNLGTLAPLTSEYDSTQTLAGRVDYRAVAGMYINSESPYIEELCKMFDIAFATEEVAERNRFIWSGLHLGI